MNVLQDPLNVCIQWKDCASCVINPGCAFCASLNKCIEGNWFGVVNKTMDYCPVNDYYYKQCEFSSLPLGIMASIVFFALLILVIIGFCYLCCCFSCCCKGDQDEEERQLLLGDRHQHHLRRTSTYYQWNKSPPTSINQFQQQQHQGYQTYRIPPESPIISSHSNTNSTNNNINSPDTWESRKSHLLKKYARDPGNQQQNVTILE
ncbi:hypothetical protein BJ944DRAFT_268705 [Cunninghamella echinulata]|nr:hypothetical protein BJ944DRAFT_268705 [Cunninghamella echinulata]